MRYELLLGQALRNICPRVFAVTAPFATALPYVIWQRAGGKAVRTIGNQPVGNLRNGLISITAWAETPLQAETLIRSIEDALTAEAAIRCIPQEEASDVYDEGGSDAGIFGMQQNFSIWAHR